jgi:hypothetical protein
MMNRFLLSLFPVPESMLQLPKLLVLLSAVRLNFPKNTLRWLALVGSFGFTLCFRLRPFRQSGFHLSGQNIFPLKVRVLSPAFRTAFYRSPGLTKINRKADFCNFFTYFFPGRNARDINRSY